MNHIKKLHQSTLRLTDGKVNSARQRSQARYNDERNMQIV